MPRLFLIIGKSGSGKSFIIDSLDFFGTDYEVVKKHTTRLERKEENKSRKELLFDDEIKETEIQEMDIHYQFRGHWYGFNKSDIDAILQKGKSPITVVRRLETLRQLKVWYPDLVTIYVQSNLSIAEMKRYLTEKGHSIKEINERIDENYERLLDVEYRLAKSEGYVSDACTAKSIHTSMFLEEVKKILDNNK